MFRELLGSGAIFGFQLLPLADSAAGTAGYTPISIFVMAPGAFFVLACLVAAQNKIKGGKKKSVGTCDGGCASCGNNTCGGRLATAEAEKAE
jgi:electron transport complex protein RnfE